MNWLFRRNIMAASNTPAPRTVQPKYPYQLVLLVEDMSCLTLSEKNMYDEMTEASLKYDIKATIREYDPFDEDDVENVAYLPSYHIYKRSTHRATHCSFGKIEKRIAYHIRRYEKSLMRKMLRHQPPR
jgi:hypothetical protein